jgi:hypothetical protein
VIRYADAEGARMFHGAVRGELLEREAGHIILEGTSLSYVDLPYVSLSIAGQCKFLDQSLATTPNLTCPGSIVLPLLPINSHTRCLHQPYLSGNCSNS